MDNKITKSIIVKANAPKAFGIWENFENFPMFMKYVESVETISDHTSHWTVRGPLGKDIEWTATMTTYEPNKRIGWNTKDRDDQVTTSGQVSFNELSHNETEVTVTMNVDPQGGMMGEAIAQIFSNPENMLEEDLYNFKNYVEASSQQAGV